MYAYTQDARIIKYNTIENVFKSTSVVCYKISYEQLIKITSSTRSRTFSHKYDLARFFLLILQHAQRIAFFIDVV